MKSEKSLLKSYFFNLLKTFSAMIFPIITFTYSARILGAEGIGRVNFAKSVIVYFTMIAMLGINHYGTRETAKRRDSKEKLSKYVHEMLFINAVTTIVAYAILFIVIKSSTKLQSYTALLFINSFSILLQAMGMEWLYQGLEEYQYIAMRSILFQIVCLIAMFVFVRTSKDVLVYAFIQTIATSGAYLLNFFNAKKYIDFRWFGYYEIKKHLKPLLWLFAMTISIELYTVLDSTMLGFMQGDVAVGKYTAAVKVNKLVNTLITSIGVVMLPRLAYYMGIGQREKVNELIDKVYNFVFLLSVPANIGLFVLSDEIMLLFSGQEFQSAAFTMRLLTPIVLVIPFSVLTNNQIFVSMGKEKQILISTCSGAVVNFICNIILIPIYAENGAAMATVIAETVVAIICYWNARCYFDMRKIFRMYYQYWISALPIIVVAWTFKILNLIYVVRIGFVMLLSIICYLEILFLWKNPFVKEIILVLKKKVIKDMHS
ncbi:MAG: flippase [Suilimivivens sp.]